MSSTLTDTLQVGNLALQITGPKEWVVAFARLWPGWMDSTARVLSLPGQKGPSWAISTRISSSAPAAEPCQPTRHQFEGTLCRISGPGFFGTIDPGRAAASLLVHPQARASDAALFVRSVLAVQAFATGEILLHAAGLVRNGQGYGLFGPSGSGKTTVAGFAEDCTVLNDDLILVAPCEGGWQMWGTPFGNGWPPPEGPVPLRALLHLRQAEDDRLVIPSPGTMLGAVVANSPVVNGNAKWLPDVFSRWRGILSQVAVRELHFRKGPAFWEVIDAEFA